MAFATSRNSRRIASEVNRGAVSGFRLAGGIVESCAVGLDSLGDLAELGFGNRIFELIELVVQKADLPPVPDPKAPRSVCTAATSARRAASAASKSPSRVRSSRISRSSADPDGMRLVTASMIANQEMPITSAMRPLRTDPANGIERA